MESAEILGKMVKSLESFGKLLEQLESGPTDENIQKIKSDFKQRLEIISSLEKIDFSEMKNFE